MNLKCYCYKSRIISVYFHKQFKLLRMASNSETENVTCSERHKESYKEGHSAAPTTSQSKINLVTESYADQTKRWPTEGKHILAQFDDKNIVVYQAFKTSIAEYAVKHQRFGGPDYSLTRMSWIKTNFLWMMYRCGWAKKKLQDRVLAITISRTAFEEILSQAFTAKLQKSKNLSNDDIQVRLQWDPDHYPNGDKVEGRKAIQLGLKGKILSKFATEWIVKVEDITEFVHEQHQILVKDGKWKILIPQEKVYPLTNQDTASRIELDFYDQNGPKLISSS